MESANFLLEALKKIAKLFNEAEVKYCLAGGLAVGTAFEIELDDVPIPVISKENLIRMKSNSSRLRDRADIEALTTDEIH